MVMKLTYDIFRKLPDNGPIWVEAVQDLEHARKRLASLIEIRPGDYVVYDAHSAKIILAAVQPA
jgi:hypothetical protein